MSMREGLPVAGYKPQSDDRIEIVNGNMINEERLLRQIEAQIKQGYADPRWAAIAKTQLEQAYMAWNRAIFQPARVELPVTNEGAV